MAGSAGRGACNLARTARQTSRIGRHIDFDWWRVSRRGNRCAQYAACQCADHGELAELAAPVVHSGPAAATPTKAWGTCCRLPCGSSASTSIRRSSPGSPIAGRGRRSGSSPTSGCFCVSSHRRSHKPRWRDRIVIDAGLRLRSWRKPPLVRPCRAKGACTRGRRRRTSS
jgi:hypothetical protein